MTGGRDARSPEPRRGDVYRRIGVEPIVNGATTLTSLGGSLMPPEVTAAMRQASECFVDLLELQEAVGRRIAELTRNEAAFVSGGAAAGLFLAAAVCMARRTADGVLRLADLEHLPRDFVIHRAHRFPYDFAVELAGGRLVEIGSESGTVQADLERAIGPTTAAVLYNAGPHLAAGVLPLDVVVRVARRHDVPVIVDAAAQLPPPDSLWAYTAAGADLVLFSGGKGLCGPASTGLVLGKRAYVERFAPNAAPLQRIGRPMKVGKEDLVGVLAAVEWYLAQDHEAMARRYAAMVGHVLAWARGRADVEAVELPTGEAGQPTPRVRIRLTRAVAGGRDALLARLRAEPPRVALLPAGDDGVYVAPETLVPGEERIVTERLGRALDDLGRTD